ncbi:hypothetical protein FOA52_004010 [Chlamydomonas sp. UWO 241]|nr:hypothetical protein FOA52_004010 [Chlamydomonas sp. UWO 241]
MASRVGHAHSRKRQKNEVFEAYINALSARGDIDTAAPGFVESLRNHFELLPTRYALDVNLDSLDVLSHARLLDEARADPVSVSYAIRPVEVLVPRGASSAQCHMGSPGSLGTSKSPRAMPAFGSSPNLQALAIEAVEEAERQSSLTPQDTLALLSRASSNQLGLEHDHDRMTFYEITVASADRPKLLSRLSEALGDVGLNIRECHAFNTTDRFSLDVFVADMLHQEAGQSLEELLGARLAQMPPGGGDCSMAGAAAAASNGVASTGGSAGGAGAGGASRRGEGGEGTAHGREGSTRGVGGGVAGAAQQGQHRLVVPPEAPAGVAAAALLAGQAGTLGRRPNSPPVDDWEIDIMQLQIDAKVAAGAFSNLYRGYYCGQEVAVKILKDVQDDTAQYQEFMQEVSIMRKARHKNVVQFIGACTRKPNLCIVFEYMSGGSVYDYVRREGALSLAQYI